MSTWRSFPLQFGLEDPSEGMVGGDSLFRSVSVSLSRLFNASLTAAQVRSMVAKLIQPDTVDAFIQEVRGVLPGEIPLSRFASLSPGAKLRGVRNVVMASGYGFQGGGDVALRWLTLRSPDLVQNKIGFLCLSARGPGFETRIDTEDTQFYVCLFHREGRDWSVVNFTASRFSVIDRKAVDMFLGILEGESRP